MTLRGIMAASVGGIVMCARVRKRLFIFRLFSSTSCPSPAELPFPFSLSIFIFIHARIRRQSLKAHLAHYHPDEAYRTWLSGEKKPSKSKKKFLSIGIEFKDEKKMNKI